MSWFLVLMFWNPLFQNFQAPEGWDPNGSQFLTICEERMLYAERYLPNYAAEVEWTLRCVQAPNIESAIAIAEGNPEGQPI